MQRVLFVVCHNSSKEEARHMCIIGVQNVRKMGFLFFLGVWLLWQYLPLRQCLP